MYTFGDNRFRKRKCDQIRLRLQGKSKDIEISALCSRKICSPLSTTLDIDRYHHLQGLVLADKSLIDGSPPNIDILIGSDYYFDIILGEIRRGDEGPVAVNSEFGWLVSGNVEASNSGIEEADVNLIIERSDASYHNPCVSNEKDELTDAVSKFWRTESIGILEPNQQSTEEDFLRDLQYDESEKRYQVSLPWKGGCIPTSNGYQSCVKRLHQVYSRLKCDQVLLKEYDHVIQQQLEAGIVERVLELPTDDEPTHYLPHHGVVRRDKLTTKVRVVFDGSAKHEQASLSINECLEKGPNLVPHLFDILVKFRAYPIGIVADVEKAFHQIQINPDDRAMLRFLWFDDISKDHPEIVQYQFCRLVFGLTPSPAILSSLIQHHLELNKEKEPQIVSLLQDSFYVDDFVGGASHDDLAIEIYEKSKGIMNAGGFALRKWTSNSKAFRERVAVDTQVAILKPKELTTIESLGSEQEVGVNNRPVKNNTPGCTLQTYPNERYQDSTIGLEDKQLKNSSVTENEDSSVKVLGMSWDVEKDEFKYDLSNWTD